MRNKIKKFLLALIIILTIFSIFLYSSTITAQENVNDVQSYENIQMAIKEIGYSYYMRGPYLQYNQRKFTLFSPEEATSQNTNYIICSAFTRNVYKELLNIEIPYLTSDLLRYSKEFVGNPEVVAYGYKSNNDLVMKLYDENEENNYKTITNPSLTDIIPLLRVGDVITATGHTILVYDIIRDANGNAIDAYLLESGFGSGHYSKTKINLDGKRLYHNSIVNTTYEEGGIQGSINLTLITKRTDWKGINTSSKRDEYSILRFIQKDDDGNAILNYKGSKYKDKDHNNEIIKLSDKVNDRLKFKKLFIEKTVDAHADDTVVANDELTYTIRVKNNSTVNYTDDINVTEHISDYVTYKNCEVNKNGIVVKTDLDNKKIAWNIGKLNSGEEVIIKYTVTVKGNCYGKTIESTGTVENIPFAIVKNKIGNKLTENEANKIQEKYDELKNQYAGKELINEIYKDSFGIDLKLDEFNITDLINNNNIKSVLATTLALNKNNAFSNMILNGYWGSVVQNTNTDGTKAFDFKYWMSYEDPDRRADTIYEENFKTGDILIYKNDSDEIYTNKNGVLTATPITYESGEYAYIYIEGKGFVGVNLGNDTLANTQDDRNEFSTKYYNDNGLKVYSNSAITDEETLRFMNYQTLLGKDYYVIFRPAIAVDILPMELEVKYSTVETTNQDVTVTITSNEQMLHVEGWNLSEDKLTLTKTFNQNTTEELKVYDYGENEKTVEIKIENIKKLEISFEGYSELNEAEKNYIENVQPTTTLVEFSNRVKTNGEIHIFKDNTEITNNEVKVSTGMKLKISLNNETFEYEIVVKGDCNGDGESDLKDLLQVNKHRLNKAQLKDEYLLAGDVNKDNTVDLKDILQINKFRLGKMKIL